jgi:uncharacterized membrane protein
LQRGDHRRQVRLRRKILNFNGLRIHQATISLGQTSCRIILIVATLVKT